MACKTCNKTHETFEADEYHDQETREVVGDQCIACYIKERNEVERIRSLTESASWFLCRAQGSTFAEFQAHMTNRILLITPEEVKLFWDAAIVKMHQRGDAWFSGPKVDKGNLIWRQVHWSSSGHSLETVGANVHATFGDVWTFNSSRGIRCFPLKPLNPSTHCLEVTGWSKSGRALFVKEHPATLDELLDSQLHTCNTCGTRYRPNGSCQVCIEQRYAKERAAADKQRAAQQQVELGYVSIKTDKPFICRSCYPKAPKGSGRCAMCRKEYA